MKQWIGRQDDRLYLIAAKDAREAYRAFVRKTQGREITKEDDPGDVNLELFEVTTLRPGAVVCLDGE